MKYPQFFAILSDQCARFAADVEVPEAAAKLLEELRSQSQLAAVDEPLRDALKETLVPLFVQAIEQAHDVAGGMIEAHVDALEKQRAETEAEFETQRKAAVEKEQAFLKENADMKAQLLDLKTKHEALEARIGRLTQGLDATLDTAPAATPLKIKK